MTMSILNTRYVPAPNQWGGKNLIHMTVDLGQLEEFPTSKIPGFSDRLLKMVPTLHTHGCSYGVPGGFVRRMTEDEGTWLGHVLEHLAIELQCLLGHDVSFGRTRSAGPTGIYNVWFECANPEAGFDAANKSHKLLLHILESTPVLEGSMKKFKLLEAFISEQIRSEITWAGDEDGRPTPPEKEFVNGPDRLVGYILVKDQFKHIPLAHAPIYQTDGPDRPFLVRTTDTRWHIPFWIVRHMYPEVERVFNVVDSERDWRGMGPGDHGKKGELEWEWVTEEPQIAENKRQQS